MHVEASSVLRLGLRARLRAAREARDARPCALAPRLAEHLEHGHRSRPTRPRALLSAAVPVCRAAVLEARGALLDLAERLPRAAPRRPRRRARSRVELLVDGAGPLYAPVDPGDLRAAALRALRALDGMVPASGRAT